MALRVRERPPLRLSCSIRTPTGSVFRWGADEHDAGAKPQGLTFGTAAPGGFTQSSMTLQRNPRNPYQDLRALSELQILGLGGSQTAWEGRIEDIPSRYDPQQAGFTPQAVGHQAHLDDDNSASEIYIDRALSVWQAPSVTRQLALTVGGWGTSFFSTQALADNSGTPGLEFSGQDPLPAQDQDTDAWYDAGAGNLLRYLRYSGVTEINTLLNGVGGWHLEAAASADDHTPTGAEITSTSGGVVDLASFGGPTRYAVILAQWRGGAFAGTSGQQRGWILANLAAIGNHGLTFRPGTSGLSPGIDDGFLASDIIAHAVGKWAPLLKFTTGPDGSIQPSSFVIPHAKFASPTTAAAMVKQASQYELLDWLVWEGPTFYSNPRGAYPGARSWRARVGEAQLQPTGPQTSRLWNGVVLTYTDAQTGRSAVVGPGQSSDLLDPDPDNPINQTPGLRRYAPLQMTSESTQAGAIQTGQRFLAEQKLLDTAGQATLTGHVMDDHGVYWPAWMVRSADTIAFIDAADNSARRIVSTNYEDQQKANQIQLDQPPDSMAALLERLGVEISALF